MSPPLVDKVLRETMIAAGTLDLQGFFNMVRHNEIKKVERRMAEVDMQLMGGANIWDDHGHYPVHIAAAAGHTGMVRMLVESQADVSQMTEHEHRTALHFAVINKNHTTTRYLIDVGARTDIKDVFHKVPRMYAVDEDIMRMVFEGETINKNISDLQEVQERLLRMNNIKIRKPHTDEGKRICMGYQLFAKEIEEVNATENLTLPLPNCPGSNAVKAEIDCMKKRGHGHFAYLCVAPREEFGSSNHRPFKSFIKLHYTHYFQDDPAVCITDIYVNPTDRKHYHGTSLLSSALQYVIRGPHPPPKRFFKVFALVNEQNVLAVKFFTNAGFVKQPPHMIPPRLRALGTAVFAVKHAGIVLNKVTAALRPGLSFDADWVTSQQLEAKRQEELKAAEDKDMANFNKKLDAFFAEKDVPRMTKLLANVAGDPILPLGVAEPLDPERDADRQRIFRTLEKRKQGVVGQMDTKRKEKGPKFTCENDRVPEAILKANGNAVLRMRDLHRWKHEIEGSRIGNSRILACPDILRDAWLDELENDALLALPDEWIIRRGKNGETVYFSKITHKTTPNRPQRKGKVESRVEETFVQEEDIDKDAGFGGSVEEAMRLKEETQKRTVKERRLWEREMDEVLDKALDSGESIASFIKRMETYYDKEKANEIILKAKQALHAQAKVEGADLNVVQAIGKRGLFQGTKDLFKTPLQKSKEIKSKITAQCAQIIQEKQGTDEADKDANGGTGAASPDRPSSAVVSAAAFGTPIGQGAVCDAPSPAESATSSSQTVGKGSLRSPIKKARVVESGSEPVSFIARHTSDAAADWIQRAAEAEQASHDADSLLEIFAPPSRSSSVSHMTAGESGVLSEAATSVTCGQLSPVAESPDKRGRRSYFDAEDSTTDHSSIAPFAMSCRRTVAEHQGTLSKSKDGYLSASRVAADGSALVEPQQDAGHVCGSSASVGRPGKPLRRPSTGLSCASTVLRSRGTPGSNLFCLDGVSRPSSTQDGSLYDKLDGTSRPNSTASEHQSRTVAASNYVPWGSHMIGSQDSCSKSYPAGNAASTLAGFADLSRASRPHSRGSTGSFWGVDKGFEGTSSVASTPATISLFGLEGTSRPSSHASRPISREAASRPVSGSLERLEWNVPWRMGSGFTTSGDVAERSRAVTSMIGGHGNSQPTSRSGNARARSSTPKGRRSSISRRADAPGHDGSACAGSRGTSASIAAAAERSIMSRTLSADNQFQWRVQAPEKPFSTCDEQHSEHASRPSTSTSSHAASRLDKSRGNHGGMLPLL